MLLDHYKMTKDMSQIHDCEKCHGKIICIEIDKVGVTRCGYCHEVVDYKQKWETIFKQN